MLDVKVWFASGGAGVGAKHNGLHRDTNAPFTFQALMNEVFQKYLHV